MKSISEKVILLFIFLFLLTSCKPRYRDEQSASPIFTQLDKLNYQRDYKRLRVESSKLLQELNPQKESFYFAQIYYISSFLLEKRYGDVVLLSNKTMKTSFVKSRPEFISSYSLLRGYCYICMKEPSLASKSLMSVFSLHSNNPWANELVLNNMRASIDLLTYVGVNQNKAIEISSDFRQMLDKHDSQSSSCRGYMLKNLFILSSLTNDKSKTQINQSLYSSMIDNYNVIFLSLSKYHNRLIENDLLYENSYTSKVRYAIALILILLIVGIAAVRRFYKYHKAALLANHEEIVEKSNEVLLLKSIRTSEEERMFRQAFGDIHPYFIENLHKSFAALTRGEELLSALLLLNYSCHDIAEILGISESSVYINRHRLRKKLSMSKDADLKELINSFDRKL